MLTLAAKVRQRDIKSFHRPETTNWQQRACSDAVQLWRHLAFPVSRLNSCTWTHHRDYNRRPASCVRGRPLHTSRGRYCCSSGLFWCCRQTTRLIKAVMSQLQRSRIRRRSTKWVRSWRPQRRAQDSLSWTANQSSANTSWLEPPTPTDDLQSALTASCRRAARLTDV